MNTPLVATPASVPLHQADGAIDITNSAAWRERMLADVGTGARAIVFDLRAARYVDSSGLSAMIQVASVLRGNSGELVLCNVAAAVMKVLELTRLTEYFVIEPSREAAMERAARFG